MRLNKVLVAGVMVFSVAGASAFAKGKDKGEMGGRGGFHKLLMQLDLSKEQIQTLKNKRKESKGEGKEVRDKIEPLMQKIHQAFVDGKSDEEIRKLHSELKVLRNGMMDRRLEHLLTIKSVLTTEQRVKFAELIKEKFQGMREH